MKYSVYSKEFDLNELCNVQIGGINTRDYPDFCDTFLEYATYGDGTELTDTEMDYVSLHYSTWIHMQTLKVLF